MKSFPRPDLLKSEGLGWSLPPLSGHAAHGMYNPMEFVVRIHPELQPELNKLTQGIYDPARLDPATVSVFSTYLHETIHWWQHVGSTAGLVLSLSYPAQTHLNHAPLTSLLRAIGPRKSLRRLDLAKSAPVPEAARQDLNRVLNNWHDIEACTTLMLSPRDATHWVEGRYFESVGHSYHIMWSACIWLLSAGIDPHLAVLPNARAWDEGFAELEKRRVFGHYYGSPVRLHPVGTREIFEGQARFSQMQYLHFASGGALDFADFWTMGMLDGVYLEAFEWFLALVDAPVPESVDDPVVALFLLICDLAINPADGFPFDIRVFESFVFDVDPATRFYLFCSLVRERHPEFKGTIAAYSRGEYEEAVETLSRAAVSPSPLAAAERIARWPAEHQGMLKLLEEEAPFRFGTANLPVRLFFSRFLRFQLDKARRPEYFVWPGAWLVERKGGDRSLEESVVLFNRHEPLFVDAPDGEIRPRLIAGRAEEDVQKTFNAFYSWCAAYNLVRQWTIADGPFDFDFRWLAPNAAPTDTRAWASATFVELFGVDPGAFEVL